MSVQRGGGVGGVSDAFSLWTWLMLFPCLSSSLAWLNLSSSQLEEVRGCDTVVAALRQTICRRLQDLVEKEPRRPIRYASRD